MFKTLILALIKSWFKAFLTFSNWRFLFLRLMISLSKPLKTLAIAACSSRGGKKRQTLLKPLFDKLYRVEPCAKFSKAFLPISLLIKYGETAPF